MNGSCASNAVQATLLVGGQALARLSPVTLFGECVLAILHPATRTLGPIYLSQLQGAVMGAPLPLAESIFVAWPKLWPSLPSAF